MLVPEPGILWREAAGERVPSGEPSVPAGRLCRGWPKLSQPQKPTEWSTQTHCKSHLVQLFVHVALPDISSRVCVCVCVHVCVCVCVCVYLLLCGDGELVAGDQTGYLLHPQIEELFTPDHLSEMLLCREKKTRLCDSTFSLIKPALILSHPLSHILTNLFQWSSRRCSHTWIYRHTHTHTNLHSCWPVWGAESRRVGQRRLVFPDSWMDEAESSGTHNKLSSPRSAGADLLRAARPGRHTQYPAWSDSFGI